MNAPGMMVSCYGVDLAVEAVDKTAIAACRVAGGKFLFARVMELRVDTSRFVRDDFYILRASAPYWSAPIPPGWKRGAK